MMVFNTETASRGDPGEAVSYERAVLYDILLQEAYQDAGRTGKTGIVRSREIRGTDPAHVEAGRDPDGTVFL